jgi:serine/threonine protein kinase
MADLNDALPRGHRLDEYKIRRVLGSGTFGITYEARGGGESVAIKEYYPVQFANRVPRTHEVVSRSSETEDAFNWGKDRFVNEAEILARLHHPNIVGIHRHFEQNGTAYIVMDLEQGETLDSLLQKYGPMPAKQTTEIFGALVSGVAEAHKNDVLHRDIKPSNIIIRPDGVPVLIDFGSARIHLPGEANRMTEVVTPGYAPIEQHLGEGQGPWTDVYGLSATLFKTMTGEIPAEAFRRQQATLRKEPDPMAESLRRLAHEGEYPMPLIGAVRKGLSVHPSFRPQTVEVLWAMLLNSMAPSEDIESPHSVAKSRARFPAPGGGGGGGDKGRANDSVVGRAKRKMPVPKLRKWLAGVAILMIALGCGYVLNKILRDPASACDQYAAYAHDPNKPKTVDGVNFRNIDAEAAIAACTNALKSKPEDARRRFQLGRSYEKQRKYGTAAKLYRKAANQGSSAAEWSLGLLYLYGRGVTKDQYEGLNMIRRAARKKMPGAYISLGWFYWKGGGKNPVKAYFWYRLAMRHEPENVRPLLPTIEKSLTHAQKLTVEQWLIDGTPP